MRRVLAVIVALAVLAPAGAFAVARVRQDDAAALQAEYRDARARARRLRADADTAERALAGLAQQTEAEQSIDNATLAEQRARLAELNRAEARLAADLTEQRAREGRLLSGLQMMSRRPPPPLLVPADRALDTVRASILMKTVAPELRQRARAMSDREADLVRRRREAALASEALFTADSARGDHRADLASRRARLETTVSVARAEAASAERAMQSLARRLSAMGMGVPSEEAETAVATLPAGRSRLETPVGGTPSQRFGPRATGWRWRAEGQSAIAPASGRVAHAGDLPGWGQVVILDLGPGWRAVISGLETLNVETGEDVQAGQVLGMGGRTGELGFDLRREERPVDPAPWLD